MDLRGRVLGTPVNRRRPGVYLTPQRQPVVTVSTAGDGEGEPAVFELVLVVEISAGILTWVVLSGLRRNRRRSARIYAAGWLVMTAGVALTYAVIGVAGVLPGAALVAAHALILAGPVLLGAGFLTRRRENLDARRTARALGLPVRRRLLPRWGIALGWVLLSFAAVLGTLPGGQGTTTAGRSVPPAEPAGWLSVGVIAAGFLFGGAHCWWQRARIRAEDQLVRHETLRVVDAARG